MLRARYDRLCRRAHAIDQPHACWARSGVTRSRSGLTGRGSRGNFPLVMRIQVVTGRPAALRAAFAERVAELRREDPLAPITVLVGASLQRPFLQRWLAARLGAHANVRILMPGDLALLLGAPALVAAERRALPPLADRVLLRRVARVHPGYFAPVAETPGFGEALYRLVRELKGAGYDLSNLGRAAGRCHRRAGEGGVAGRDPRRVRGAPALASTVRTMRCWRRTRRGSTGSGCWCGGCSTCRRRSSGCSVGDRRADAGRRLPARCAGGRGRPAGRVRERLIAGGARAARAGSRPTAGSGARSGCGGDCSRRRRRRRSPPTERCGWCRRPTRRGRCARPRARACSGRGRACRSGRWRSPTGTARRIGRWSRRCSSRRGSRCTCTRARRWRSGRSAARRSALLDLYDTRALAPVGDGLPHRRAVPERAARGVRRHSGGPLGLGLAPGRDRRRRRAVGTAARGAAGRSCRRRRARTARLGDASGSPTPDSSRGSSPSSTRGFARIPGGRRGPRTSTTCRDCSAATSTAAEEVVDALRGLERFTALEAEVEFRAVPRRRAPRDRDAALGGRARRDAPGAFARRGVNVVAVNSLAGIEFRARVDPRRDRAGVPAAGATGPDPARRRARGRSRERAGRRWLARARRAAARRRCSSRSRAKRRASDWSSPTRAARPARAARGCPRSSSASSPRSSRASACRPRRRRCLTARTSSGSPATRSARRSRAAATPTSRGGQRGGRRRRSPSAERDRTYLQARVTRPLAIATFERAAPSFARALDAERARRSARYSRVGRRARAGRAGGDRRARARGSASFSPTSLENYATCPQQFLIERRAAGPGGRGARADGADRRTPSRQPVSPDLPALPRRVGRAEGRRRSPPTRERADARDRRARSATRAAERGETGYPAMWAADRIEVIEDCLRWLEVEREDPLTPALPLVRCEARFGRRYAGRAGRARCRATSRSRSSSAGGTLRLPGRIDRITWDARAADALPGRSTTRPARSATRSPAQLQGGRMLQLPLYVLAGAQLLGSTPRAGEAAYVYPTRRGEFRAVAWTREQLAERHDDVIALLAAILDGDRPRRLHDRAVGRGRGLRVLRFQRRSARARAAAYMERKAADPRLARFGERDQERRVTRRRWSTRRARERIAERRSTRTCASRPPPAPARRPCSSSGSSTCSPAATVNVDRAGRDHVHREGRRRARDAGARRARGARAGAATARSATRLLRRRARPVSRAHRDDPQLRDRAAARAPGRGGDRPAVRGARGARRQPRLRRRLRALPGRAARRSRVPSSSARCGAGSGSRSCARRASTCNEHRYLLPLTIPRHGPTTTSPTHARELRRDRRRAARAARRSSDPGDDKAVADRRGDHRVGRRARGARHRPSRSACCCSDGRPKTNLRRRLARRTGAATKQRLKELQERLPRRARSGAGLALRSERAARPAPAHRAVRRRLRARAQARRARPTSTTCCSGRATCCATAGRRATTSAAGSGPC